MTDQSHDVPVLATAVVEWLNQYADEPLDEGWVPGTTNVERRRLFALGGLVKALLDTQAGNDIQLTGEFDDPRLKEWLAQAPHPPTEVIFAGVKLLENDMEDGLASLYAACVSSSSRRRLGTFFTPAPEVARMIERWDELGHRPASIVDVGAGVGIFTMAAAAHWPDAQVWAVDVNPVTLGLLGLRVLSQQCLRPGSAPEPGVRLVLEDYVSWTRERWTGLRKGRLVLGNPPYTRSHLLPESERERLSSAAAGLCGRRASLSALITGATIRMLEPEDGLCLLLPAQWLEADYALSLREWLWSAKNRRLEIHLFESDLFRDAQVDAVSLLVGPEADDTQPFQLSSGRETPFTMERNGATPVQWRHLLSKARRTRRNRPADSRLSDFGTVKRGVATGDNSFFVLTSDACGVHRLPGSALRPVVRRLRDYPDDNVTAATLNQLNVRDRRWLLVTGNEPVETDLSRYIALGESAGVAARVLCRQRRQWYDLSKEATTPDIIVGAAAKGVFRFLENDAGAVITNNLYGFMWHPHVPTETRRRLLAWLRSSEGQEALNFAARTQGGGLRKIEPRALNELVLPPSF